MGVTCTALGPCYEAGTCDPSTGNCSNPVADAGAPCACGVCNGEGVCSATLLGTTNILPGTAEPQSLAVDANNVYFGNCYAGFAGEASVGEIPKLTGATVSLGTNFTGYPQIAPAPGLLYYANGADLWSVPTDGGALYVDGGSGPTLVATGSGDRFLGIATDGVNIYLSGYSSGTIYAMPIGGTALTPIATGQDAPEQITTDGTNVYWLNAGDLTVRETSIAGGGPVKLLATGMGPIGIAVDATSVYFTDGPAGTVNSVPIDGGTVQALASGLEEPYGITVLGSDVYFTQYNEGFGGQASKTLIGGDGGVTTLGYDVAPVAIAHDSQCIYWVDTSTAAVFMSPP